MTSMRIRILLLISLVATSPLLMHGRAAGPIKQTFVGEVSYNPYVKAAWAPIKIGTVTIKISDVEDEIVVSGRDKKDRPWNVYVKTAGGVGGSWAWTADIEGEGTNDLIFVHQNALNGRCVDRKGLTLILFDSEGRPSPWELEGYFRVEPGGITETGRGVLDLGDWNKNGRAELVQTDCYGYDYQQLSYTPYGLVDVYEANKGVWQRLSSRERAGQEAIYREIAGSDGRKLAPRPKELGAFIPNYSNDRAGSATSKITASVPRDENFEHCGVLEGMRVVDNRIVELPDDEKQIGHTRCHDHFLLENGIACFGKPGIVLMRPDATEAVMDGESERARSLLKQIISDKLSVTLTGQLEEGICSPTLIWANKH